MGAVTLGWVVGVRMTVGRAQPPGRVDDAGHAEHDDVSPGDPVEQGTMRFYFHLA